MTFFIVEKLVRIVRGEDVTGHSHSYPKLVEHANSKESDGEEESHNEVKQSNKVKEKVRFKILLMLKINL